MNQKKLVKSPVPPPPSVDDLTPHRPLNGVRRLAALAIIKRVPQFTSLALAGLALYAGAATFTGRSHIPDGEVSLATAKVHTETEASRPGTPPSVPVVSLPVTVVKTVPLPGVAKQSEANKIPVVAAKADAPAPDGQTSEPLPAVPGVTADMTAVDIGDIAASVDTLGIRADGLESTLGDRQSEAPVETAAPEAKVVADSPKLPDMSPEDSQVHERLKARLKDVEAKGDKAQVKAAKAELDMFEATLATLIEFRIVDRKGEKPGFWRTLVDDPKTKQFFVVVEAVVDGAAVNWAVRDADSGKIVSAAKFAIKVDEKTFAELSADKKDDGRIANMVVGLKPIGRITPVWSIKTDGETITGF